MGRCRCGGVAITTTWGRLSASIASHRVKTPGTPYASATLRAAASSRWQTATTGQPWAWKAGMWARPYPSPMTPMVGLAMTLLFARWSRALRRAPPLRMHFPARESTGGAPGAPRSGPGLDTAAGPALRSSSTAGAMRDIVHPLRDAGDGAFPRTAVPA